MNKELEAFERIKKGVDDNIWDGNEYDDLDIIEKGLKALEIIKRTALKLVSLEDDTTICVKGRYAFYDGELYQSEDLTQEEYDLLKEVLL